MKLVKEILTETYKLISDAELAANPILYIDRTNNPIYIEMYVSDLSDIKLANTMIKDIYTNVGWSNLRDKDKLPIARLLSYTLLQTELDEVLTPQEQVDAKLEYVTKSKIARSTRWEYLRQQIALEVTEAEALAFYTDTKPFKDDYIDAGLPHLELWLTNGDYAPLGIDYTTTGFAQQSYYTASMLQMCIDYLITGNQYVS